jgi:UDP-N-acetylmuramoyl-L-alanyl-D-glutamate--2,6-diaminopimelate ligase
MNLTEIIKYINPRGVVNYDFEDYDVSGVSYNSRTAKNGDIFVCLIGEHVDGHDFAQMAQEKGAVCIVAQKSLNISGIPVVIVENTQMALSQIANMINGFPSKSLRLTGVTGTNGKTTVTHLVENIMEYAGLNCGLIGTLGQRMSSGGSYTNAKHTTPQSPELQSSLKSMKDNGIKNVVMEVSSHALEQYRVFGCEFAGAVLTNLTQDHLDYHITMDNYLKAKGKLFSSLAESSKENKFAVINNDDESVDGFKKFVPENVRLLTYGVVNEADVTAHNIEFTAEGTVFECITPVGEKTIRLQMTGMFSVYNALAALCVGICENIDLDVCIKALEATKNVAGRFETVTKKPLSIVDYAHTPDGLENVLTAAKRILPENGKLICVFGCGGDRDATKRPKMGRIAEELADKIVITSDNPRSEDPQQIITDILTGIKSLNTDKVFVEIDRKNAIELAVKIAGENDVIVFAGKGHEDYQILKNETIHFDDREEVKLAFEKIKKGI